MRSAGEGPLLLLLHGLGSSSLDWQAQIERFSEHYRVVALDLRGHGQSMQEGPFDVATLAADVVNWLDAQPEPAWVVGLSLGAMVALELALQLPYKCRGWCWSTVLASFCWKHPKSRSVTPSVSSGCAGSVCARLPGGWDASSSRARISRRCATPSGCVSCAIKRKPTRHCWRRSPAGRCAPGSAPSGSRWPSSPPVTTTCR
ncbi:alpha/beta fold hydrolase [Aeromonas veronii]|uniref:alpha/beta fold hydrolase n=1 Tax=Aeromonas veronii TaxID=654 RepID=UPI003F79CADD